MMWYRAVVLFADDLSQFAMVFFIDFGNCDMIPYQNMRKTLLCYDYRIQASRCRLSRYPRPNEKPTEDEVVHLYELLMNKKITVRVLEPEKKGCDPIIDIWFTDEGEINLRDIISSLRHSPVAHVTPTPTIPLSSVDLEDSIFDEDSELSDNNYPIFNFDVNHKYLPLSIPRRVLLPINFVTVNYDDCVCVFNPQRYSLKDSPQVWQEQVANYAGLHAELQKAAPLFPDVGVIESGNHNKFNLLLHFFLISILIKQKEVRVCVTTRRKTNDTGDHQEPAQLQDQAIANGISPSNILFYCFMTYRF